MRFRSWPALALSAIIALPGCAHAPPAPPPAPVKTEPFVEIPGVDSAKVVAIRHLMEAMGVRANMESALQVLIAVYQQRLPSVPPAFWSQVRGEFKTDQLLNMVIPIYDRHYSMRETQALTTFFESPTGRKFVAAQPSMLRESMEAGAAWGQQVGARITKELEAAGYKMPAS
jgi:hypothetical protein